jgi:minor extracellular serine protease Vpr
MLEKRRESMRIIFSLLLVSFLMSTAVGIGSEVEEVMMIEVDEQHLQHVWKEITEAYPDVQIRYVYKHSFYGMSVKGRSSDLQQINNIRGVKSVIPVNVYKAKLDESVPFILGKDQEKLFHRGKQVTGKGVKIGIIDTGIDYTHPDLKKNYRGGYDTIDFDDNPMETTKKQGIPTFHGTHVAGIIAANGKVKGVAPDAEIYAYRALGPGGVGTTESVIAAIDKAIADKVDILNLSLGNEVNGPDWPTTKALERAISKGIIAVTASGNSGPKKWTVGSPGTASHAISVGASLPPLDIPYVQLQSTKKEIAITPMQGAKPWKLAREEKIVFGGLGDKRSVRRARHKIVLVERGRLTFTEKAKNAERAGAKAVIISNNVPGALIGKIQEKVSIPIVSITYEDGQWMKQQLQKRRGRLTTKFRHEVDRLAPFSSRGPVTVSWEIKPDVVAPGVAIKSTIPGGYKSLQGTSMAAPHVAGAIALLKEAHPTWTSEQCKAALMNNAKPLYKKNGDSYHLYEQGAGRIQVSEALHATTLIYPSSLSLGISSRNAHTMKKEVYVTVHNQSREKKKYEMHVPHQQEGVEWKLPSIVYVKPHEKKRIKLTAIIHPTNAKKSTVEGLIVVKEGSKQMHVPYSLLVGEQRYPRIMGFRFEKKKEGYQYEVYLPAGADEVIIALYDPYTFTYVRTLDTQKNVQRGIMKRKLNIASKEANGIYKVIVFAKKGNIENAFESVINFKGKFVN